MAYDFNSFYLTLQQSALFYSNLALRQMQVGYGEPLLIPAPNSILPQQPQKKDAKNVGRTNINVTTTTTTARIKHPSSDPVVVGPNAKRNSWVPPVVINTEENYSVEAGSCSNNKTQRKVYFAHPLSTVKIKSPTPMHSYEDARASGTGNCVAEATNSLSVFQNGIMNYLRGTESSSVDEEELFQINEASSTSGNMEEYLDLVSCQDTNKKKKSRKKRKKTRSKSYDQSWEQQDTSQYYLSSNSNTDFLSPEDPCAIYEVPLNENDYQFVSEIRLCTSEDLKLVQQKNASATIRNEQSVSSTNQNQCEERKKEMAELYGVSGAERIITMEDAIEAYFEKEKRSCK